MVQIWNPLNRKQSTTCLKIDPQTHCPLVIFEYEANVQLVQLARKANVQLVRKAEKITVELRARVLEIIRQLKHYFNRVPPIIATSFLLKFTCRKLGNS